MTVPASVTALDVAVRRLLRDDKARDRFARDPECLGTDPRITSLLKGINRSDLSRLAGAVVRGVANGSLCGTDLQASFARTLLALGAPLEESVARFVASREFARVEVVGNRPGFPASRAFYEWALTQLDDVTAQAVAQQEYVRALLAVLATTKDPVFTPEADGLVRRVPHGWVAVLDANRQLNWGTRPLDPIAMGVGAGRMWGGRLPDYVCAALLRMTEAPPLWALQLVSAERAAQIAAILEARRML